MRVIDFRNQDGYIKIQLEEPSGLEPGYRHPHVIVQNNVFNASKIINVIVCTLTSNRKRAQAPGNVLLEQALILALTAVRPVCSPGR